MTRVVQAIIFSKGAQGNPCGYTLAPREIASNRLIGSKPSHLDPQCPPRLYNSEVSSLSKRLAFIASIAKCISV
jgi:hypothetical protein